MADKTPKFDETEPLFDETQELVDEPKFEETKEIKASDKVPTKTESAVRGLGEGVTFGTQPLLAGAGAAATQAVTGDQGPKQGRSLEALYAAYKDMKSQEMKKNKAAQEAHPVISGAANLVGAIPTSVAAGAAGLTGLGGAAIQGSAAGAGSYLGSEEDPTLKGAAASTLAGGIGGGILHQATPAVVSGAKKLIGGASKMAGKLVPEGMKQGFQAGEEGINLLGKEAQQQIIPSEASNSANLLTNKIVKARESLGKEIGGTIQKAASEGKTINMNKELQDFSSKVDNALESGEITQDEADRIKKSISFQLFKEAPQEAEQMGTVQELQRFTPNKEGEMNPSELRKTVKLKDAAPEDLQNVQSVDEAIPEELQSSDQQGQLSDIINGRGNVASRSVKSTSKLMTPATEGVTRGDVPVDQAWQAGKRFENLASQLYDKEGSSPQAKALVKEIQGTIKNKLTEALPEFAQQNQTFDLYNQYLPETLMSKGETSKLSGVRYGSTNNPELKLKQATESLITDLNKSGVSSKDAKQTFNQLSASLDNLQSIDKSMAAAAEVEGKPYESIFNKLGLNKDEILQYIQRKSKRSQAYDTFSGGQTVSLHIPKTVTGIASEMVGKAGVATGNIGGQIYGASKEVLGGLASKLQANPEVKNLGKALEDAVTKGDTVKRNAAIFAIMQNPRAKAIIDPNLKEEYQNESTATGTPTGGTSENGF